MRILVQHKSVKIPTDDASMADLILIINRDGTFDVVKNRYGFQDLIGNHGQLLDTGATNNIGKMALSKQQEKNNATE